MMSNKNTVVASVRSIPFVDLHQDIAGAFSEPELAAQTDFAQLGHANTKLVLATGFTLPDEDFCDVMDRDLAYYEAQCSRDPSWTIVMTKDELSSVFRDPLARGIIFHIEGFPQVVDPSLLEHWYTRGWRSTGLVWNDDNPFGGGTHTATGLTSLGHELIEWCESKRILIDLAHANQHMLADCLTACTRPPFISHGGVHSVTPNARNYSETQLRSVAEKGGILGIFFAKGAMASRDVFAREDIVAHVAKAVEIMGEDAVAIGSDFGGAMSGVPLDMRSVSEIEHLWNALRTVGFSPGKIEKIASLNAKRYLEDNFA